MNAGIAVDVTAGVSGVGGTTYVALLDTADALPAVSRAVTVMVFGPGANRIDADQLLVPVAVPLPPRLLTHDTDATAPLSDATPESASVR
jgi:hypothetical protein